MTKAMNIDNKKTTLQLGKAFAKQKLAPEV